MKGPRLDRGRAGAAPSARRRCLTRQSFLLAGELLELAPSSALDVAAAARVVDPATALWRLQAARNDPRVRQAIARALGSSADEREALGSFDRLWSDLELALQSRSLVLLVQRAQILGTPTHDFEEGAVDLSDLAEPGPAEQEEPEPQISFVRAGVCCGAVGSPGGEHRTTAVPPVPAAVLGYLGRWDKPPPEESLVRVRVQNPTEMKVELTADGGSVELDLSGVEGATVSVSEKRVLPYYGDAGDLDGAEWEGIELLDVTGGGDVPFGLRIEAKCGAGEGTLGVFDLVFGDPDGGPGRSARFGLFKTREPAAKFALPEIDVSRVRVLLDDAEDATADTLDITDLVGLSGDVTSFEFPAWIESDGGPPGEVNEDDGRRRMVDFDEVDVDEPDGDCALFMLGENRIKLMLDDELLLCTHSFHYVDDALTVPSGYDEMEQLDAIAENGGTEIIRGSLTLDFVEDADDATISTFFHAARLRPRSLAPHYKIVEGRVHENLDHAGLQALVTEIEEFDEEPLESLGLTPVAPADPEDTGILERIPTAFQADFSNANDTFNNAARHWHHFVIHTFPAHRLIEEILLPQGRPPIVALSGVQFDTNKTFVRPAAFDSLRRVRELYDEDPARKIATFGHTDRVGDSSYNEGLSHVRARSVDAMLRREAGFWFDRFAKHNEVVGTAPGDQQWALQRLGYSGLGPTDLAGVDETALHSFQTDQGLPEGSANHATRVALANALRTEIGATGETLSFETMWGTKELQHMLKHLGHYAGSVNGVYGGTTRTAVVEFQTGQGLGADGDVGIVTRMALIEAYFDGMVVADLDASRFHAGAVFGCGEAFPRVPTADGVESQQNRRVEIIFRRDPVEPIDPPNQLGALCPYVEWQEPEMSEDREAELPNVVVACGDSGLGRGANDNYSGNALQTPNRLMIKGERLIRPTDVSNAASGTPNAHTVAATGDLTRLADGSGHGTAVMTCMACDGVGNNVGGSPRTVQNAVLGVAPHIKLRPIRKPNRFFPNLLCLEIVASDPDVFAYSTSSHLYRANMTAAQRRALQERLQDMCAQGKVALASAGNYRSAYTGEYDTATREFGGQAPDRRVSRQHASYSGADAHRPRILIVGSSEEVTATGPISAPGQRDTVANHTYLGEQVGIHTPGVNICAASPLTGSMGNLNGHSGANGYSIGGIGGTSFATPMTAGIVGELMMLDADLTQPANLPRALEYVEATADDLPNVNPAGGQGAGAGNPRNADPGPNAGGPVNGQLSPTAASTYQNIRRIHFWKAVLATLNKGLAAEGRGSGGATDPLFQHCTLIDEANTVWYGFEVRSPVPNALLYWRKSDGTYVPVNDDAATFPGGVTRGATWRLSDQAELAAGQPLPAYPWTRANFTAAGRTPYYLCQLSIRSATLDDYDALVMHLPEIDPLDPEGPAAPPILEVPVADRAKLRDPASQGSDADVRVQSLATFARFDDFVLYASAVPQAVDHFVFIAEDRRDDAGVGEELNVLLFAVDAFGNIGTPGTITTNVTHDGTAGATGTPNVGVFLGGAPAAAAGVAPTFGAGTDHPGMARLRFQGNTQETVTLSFDDGAGHTGSLAIDVRPAGPLDGYRLELRRRGGGADVVDTPVTAGEAFELEVTAVDSGGVTVGTHAGDVTLSLLAGEMGSDGPPARGLHVKGADADPFDANAFTMTLSSGVGVYPLFCYTTGPLHVQVEDDVGNAGQSRQIEIDPGALAQFRVLASTPHTTGNAFEVEVTALDANGNVLADYAGAVTLAVGTKGTAAATAGDGTRSGAFIEATAGAGDDTYQFSHTDEGVHNFSVTCYTAETITFSASESGGITAESSDVVVNGTAVDHFGFEVDGADRAGTSFQLTVTALDANDEVVSDYAGTVTLSLASGTAFAAGPPQVGNQIGPAASHTMTSSDHGSFTFTITPHTAETVRFSATDGTVTTQSDDVVIESGAMENFVLTAPASVARRTAFQVRVDVHDADGNIVPAFAGPVTLTRARNGGAQRNFTPTQIHTFSRADNGTFTYTVSLSRRGTYVIQASDGNQTNVSAAVTIT